MAYRDRDTIFSAMVALVSSIWDKSVGSFIYDALKGTAIELETLHRESEATLDRMFLETTSGDSLILKAADYGVVPVEAAKADGVVQVTGSAGATIAVNDLFAADEISFKTLVEVVIPSDASIAGAFTFATDSFEPTAPTILTDGTKVKVTADTFPTITGGGSLDGSTDYYIVSKGVVSATSFKISATAGGAAIDLGSDGVNVAIVPDADIRVVDVTVEAVVAAEAGNVPAGSIVDFPVTLTDISAVTNADPTEGGVDEEDDEALRDRTLDVVRSKRTSGNADDYIFWAREVPGVGNARCVPIWDGPGTVKVILLDTDFEIPSGDIVTDVEEYIETKRPIGADVTVVAATEVAIEARATVTLVAGAVEAQVVAEIDAAILAYVREHAADDNRIGWAAIVNIVFDNQWVEDYTVVQIKGTGGSQSGAWGTANILCLDAECPTYAGPITLTVS
jgi:uncharacterized phage protein gp47/JayE